MSHSHSIMPNEVYEVSPDDGNDWRKILLYSKTEAGMKEDVNGDWVKIREGRYERLRIFNANKSGVSNMWEYVKGSEADFEGAPEWATILEEFGTSNFWVEHYDLGGRYQRQDGNSTLRTSSMNTSKGYALAQRRKVDSLQSRVNDASLQQAFDIVQRPAHYNQSGIECIDAIAASMTPVEFRGFLKGNVQKYVWRSEHKGGVEDYRKAQYYLDRLVKELSK